MSRLLKSLKRTNGYSQGGILAVLAIPTLLENGAAGFAVTRDPSGEVTAIAPATGNAFQLIEPEENSCSFAENLKVSANRYLLHQIGFKYGALSVATSEAMQALNLGRHTFLVKLKTGKAVLLGERNGLTAEKNDGGAGASNDDLAGYDLLLSGGEVIHAAVLPATLFDTIAATVVNGGF